MEYTKVVSDDLSIALIHFGAVSKLSLYDKENSYSSHVLCASTVKDKIVMGYLLFFLMTNSLNITPKFSLRTFAPKKFPCTDFFKTLTAGRK